MCYWFLYFHGVIFASLGTLNLAYGYECVVKTQSAFSGFSRFCSHFSLASDDNLQQAIMPSGVQVYFKVATFYVECAEMVCLQTYKACDVACPCCKPYMGADPGYLLPRIWADQETSLYMQNLKCIVPPYIQVLTGFQFFTCNFSGYGMANTTKLVQIILSWRKKPLLINPFTLGVYIVAGTVSLPDCIWQWERGNKFPLNEYGVFRILLYDGYGNQITAATGGTNNSIVPIDVSFQKYDASGNDTAGANMLDVHTSWKLTYQIEYGFCTITMYCSSEGKYQMKVMDKKNRTLGNTPTAFYVMSDEAWTGKKYIPPPAPETFFLGDDSTEKARAGVTEDSGAPTTTRRNLLLTIMVVLFLPCMLVKLGTPKSTAFGHLA